MSSGSVYGTPDTWTNTPASMRAIPQWGVWGYSAEGQKWPRDLQTGRRPVDAHSDSSVTTFEDAVQRAVALRLGLYFDLRDTDPFTGVDLDDSVDGGVVHPAALEVVQGLGGYCEVSPSGTGLKVTLEGSIPKAVPANAGVVGPWGGGLEIYDRGRFWAVTGRVIAL